jgi:uncharacterized protein YjdB
MKKLTRILMMMLVLSVGTGITSCDEIENMIDNPVVPEPTPTPTPEPTPQPTPEEIENQRIAEAQALLEESRQEGALVNLTYTVNGVERVASFKRVGDKYVLQNPSATRADGAEGDEYVPYLMDYDTDEDPENDQDLDDADLDKDIEEEFEYEDGDDSDDDDLDDDDDEDLDNDAIADQLDWEDFGDDDDDAADGDDDDEVTAVTRALKSGKVYKFHNMLAGFSSNLTYADCTQALLMTGKATFTQCFAQVEYYKTRSQDAVMAFTGKIEVNGKTFTYKPSEASTRASNVKVNGNMRIKKVVLKTKRKLTYNKENKMQVQVLPNNAKVTKVTWIVKSDKFSIKNVKAKRLKNKIISTCSVTPLMVLSSGKIQCRVKGKNTKKKSYKVIVVYATVKGVTISPSSLTFTEGDQPKQLKATVTPSNANPSVIWKSDKEDVAIVDKNGNVTPKGVGTATITCTSVDNPKKTATCTVTVNAAEVPISSLKLSQTSLSLFVGGTATLTAEVNSNATSKTVTWSVSEGTAVTVDQTGKVTAVAAGDATITAKAGEKTATCTVTVSKKAGSISFKESTVNVDNTASPFTNTLTNTGDGAVTYKSSDDSVAKVDADGKVTLKGVGTATIIATVADSDTYHYDKNEVSYTINVSALPSNIAEPIDYGHEDSPF